MESIDKLDLKSLNISEDKKSKLKELFPEVFSEDKVDFDKLKLTLGEDIADNEERFGLQWAGKKDCFKVIQEPSVGTLKPCKEESVNWDTTENLFIEGDNLEVLKQLQKAYYGKVKMIYIDPPYNTGGEFIYPDRFQENLDTYLAYTGQVNDQGKKFSTNTETSGRFHSNWLNMMYPRLFLARNLLKNDGVIFISIDDHEIDNLRKIANEVFGEENFVTEIAWRKSDNQANIGQIARVKEYILCYCKDRVYLNLNKIPLTDKAKKEYSYKDEIGNFRRGILLDKTRGRHFYDVTTKNGKTLNGPWMIKEIEFRELDSKNLILWTSSGDEQPYSKIYLHESNGQIANDFWDTTYGSNQEASINLEKLFEKRIFDFPKSTKLLGNLITIGSNKNDIILDFFSGSCSTAHAVLDLNKENGGNRKFIMAQLPEPCDEKSEAFKAGYKTIADIGKERIRKVIKKIETEVQEEEIKNKAKLELEESKPKTKLDLGFKVFKLDRSNFKTWDGNTENDGIQNQLEKALFHIDTKSSEEDILTEIILKSGFQLTVRIEEITLAAKKVFSIADGSLIVCLDKDITKELIQEIAKLEPARVVCLDSGFKERDELKTNAIQIMKSHGVDDFRTV